MIQGIHADNGSEYINHRVAALLNKLRIGEFTKSRPRHCNDNVPRSSRGQALAESKNASVVRKYIGHGHILNRPGFPGAVQGARPPNLLRLEGVGVANAGELMVAAAENPHRLRCEASFAMMCGACPLPASSGEIGDDAGLARTGGGLGLIKRLDSRTG